MLSVYALDIEEKRTAEEDGRGERNLEPGQIGGKVHTFFFFF